MTDAAPKTCFIAMPVRTTEEHSKLYDDPQHWNNMLEHLFVPAVEKAGFEAWRPIAQGSDMIHAEIVKQLIRADLVLVDMSHNNPNVFFELGVRTSVNKPVALVRCDAMTPIPFDVAGINTHTYEPRLKPWNHEAQVNALVDHLIKAVESSGGMNTMWRQFGMELTATEPTTGGVSKEEAMLEVLSQQVAELNRKVEQPRGGNSGPRRANIGQSILAPRSVADDWDQSREFAKTAVLLESMASELGVRFVFDTQPGEGLTLVVVNMNSQRGVRQFMKDVASLEQSGDLPPIKIVLADPDDDNPPWEREGREG